jgi:hypothetical protein
MHRFDRVVFGFLLPEASSATDRAGQAPGIRSQGSLCSVGLLTVSLDCSLDCSLVNGFSSAKQVTLRSLVLA